MAVHLIKLAAGVRTPELLRARMEARAAAGGKTVRVLTANFPKRREELENGGSLYWVTGGRIHQRQPIVGLEEAVRGDGRKACAILLSAGGLVDVCPAPRKAFQGWRYLEEKDAPADMATLGDTGDLPPSMVEELRSMGLL